jgi:hypothetical protein
MPQRASVFCNFYIRVDREALVSERALEYEYKNVFLTFLGDSSKLVIESRVPMISMKLYRQDLKRKNTKNVAVDFNIWLFF